ncbi:MBL fold metallo-hydrolase [Polaromonas sp.]|uniref:MBL fold metallo-hydrolase n=1 Tax=Polaromonas sp. TaxID=1869339 RepID=UPI003BAAB787
MSVPPLPAGVHVFERGWLSANSILFTDGDQSLMVDSGYCTHAAQTLSLVESVLESRPLDILVNTHLHSDHCGGNAALQGRYPAMQTLIPPGQAAHVADWDPVALTYSPTGQFCPRFSFDKTLQPGTRLQFGSSMWEVHAAAGHDPHSLVFFEPRNRILISADALWENGFGVVFPELEGESAFSEVAATLDMIERLAPTTVIPGHGRVFAYTPEVLATARQRLNAFVKNPLRHVQHAAKVLLKFKLLEVQRQPFDDFSKWALATPYFVLIQQRFFADMPAPAWIAQLCDELVKAGAAERDGIYICNA